MGVAGEPVDAVYSWVDGSTPRFAHDLQLVCAGAERSAVDVRRRRFRDNGELRYSMRSLVRFAPWLRRIYLVTNGDVPAWLARYSNRVEVVTHAALFDTTDDLPTFNSNAIEMHLHRIPGLSRKFLYLNDDVFFGRPCTLAGFSDGGTDFFLFERQRCPSDSEHGEVHDRAYAYTARRVSVVTGCPLLTRLPAHTPQLYDREAISQLEEQFRAEFQATASHRLRRSTDFVLRIAYAAAAESWATEGRTQHYVVLPATDERTLDAWFKKLKSSRIPTSPGIRLPFASLSGMGRPSGPMAISCRSGCVPCRAAAKPPRASTPAVRMSPSLSPRAVLMPREKISAPT